MQSKEGIFALLPPTPPKVTRVSSRGERVAARRAEILDSVRKRLHDHHQQITEAVSEVKKAPEKSSKALQRERRAEVRSVLLLLLLLLLVLCILFHLTIL